MVGLSDLIIIGVVVMCVSEELTEIDETLYNVMLRDMPKGYRYTFIYTTTPADAVVGTHKPVTYDPEFMEAFHMDLKRDYYASKRENETNSTDFRPLFEKYEYFNPGMSSFLFSSEFW